jgi:hypothetical protein
MTHSQPEVTPLSRSQLYGGLRDFYSSAGPSAWRARVPFHVTSNAFIADAYANIIVRLVQDLLASDRLERSEPLYVVELGAGHGRFGFLALQRLAVLLEDLTPEFQHVVYVMTDFASANLDHWRTDEALLPFITSGSLRFALFDANSDTVLTIAGAAEITPARPARNPLVVVANYVLDALPQDLFRRRADGVLEEGFVRSATAAQLAAMPADRRQLPLSWGEVTLPRYEDPRIDRLLQPHDEPQPATFLVPTAAVGLIDRLAALAPAGMVMIATDAPSGFMTLEWIDVPDDGYFHLPVNFDLIGRYARARGDSSVWRYPLESLESVVITLGLEEGCLKETEHAADTYLGTFGLATSSRQSEFLNNPKAFDTVTAVLAVARASQWDTVVFNQAVPFFLGEIRANKLEPGAREQLEAGVDAAMARYHPRTDPAETTFNAGLLLQELGLTAKATNLYVQSWELVGPAAPTAFNIAMCALDNDDRPNAMKFLEAAVKLDPEHVLARRWMAQLAHRGSVAESESEPRGGGE